MSKHKVLAIDLESFSDVDLGKCGVYRYVEGDFHILLFAYAFDDEDVKIVDMACGEELPQEVLDAIDDPEIIKTAWNAQFERTCIGHYLGRTLSPDSWRCTMVHAASLSLPLSLKEAAKALGTGEQKDRAGEALIRYFSVPCKATKANGGRTRNLPEHDMAGWEKFKSYCLQDVRTERDIRKRLEMFPLIEHEWDFYHTDQRINDRGVLIDKKLVEQAIACDLMLSDEMTKKAYELTGLENPNSVSQLKRWLGERGIEIDSLGKKNVEEMIKDLDKHSADGEALEMLKLRLQMAKSSVKKYQAAERCTCRDGRARGLFQFSGAVRTQRWCLTGDHEVLTPECWVRLDEWKGGAILCWNARSEAVSFQRAKALCFDYSGPMYTYTDKRIDQCSTPDHRMRVQKHRGEPWQDMTVEEMAKCRPCIPVVSPAAPAAADIYGYHQIIHEITVRPVISDFTGKVYCAETGTGYFLVRRNGRVWVTGNSGRNIQLQNLPQNHIGTLDEARELIKMGAFDMVESIYGNTPEILSQLIRTMLIAKPGHKFIVADFSAIEARVLAWLAGEKWRQDAFERGDDIYCASASQMFGVPVVKHGINGELRQKGKVAELACIAKGQPVLTNHGLIPIEEVTPDDRVWDGMRYVHHDGVVYKGRKPVITYEGLTATGDHIVYLRDGKTTAPLGVAADYGWDLASSWNLANSRDIAVGRREDADGQNTVDTAYTVENDFTPRLMPVYDIINAGPRHCFTVSGHLVHNCGYGGSVGALKTMGALDMGLKEDELQGLIDDWREANPHIVQFWWDIEKAAIGTIKDHKDRRVGRIGVEFSANTLWLQLPSGRRLAYIKPKLEVNRFGRMAITYDGLGQNNKWQRIETYSGKLVENITQATARDILAEAMWRFEKAGIDVVGHVHDEAICEVPEDSWTVDDVCRIMNQNPVWADGIVLNSAGMQARYYFKD